MRSPFVRLALLAFSLLGPSLAPAQTLQAVSQSARILSPVQPQTIVTLDRHVPVYASAAAAVPSTALAPSTPISGVVVLLSRAPQVEAAFQQLLADQLNPNSPRYHQWLTPQQVGALYGPAQSDVDAVTAWLTSAGLIVTGVSPSRTQITVNGSVQTLSSAFATSFRTFTLANGESRYSLTQEPSVPAALAPVISAVAGLSQVIHAPASVRGALIPAQTSGSSTSGVRPQVTATDGTHYLLDSDFNIAFDVNAALNAGYTGSGQRIAVAGLSRVYQTDTSTVQTLSGENPTTINTVIPTNGADPGPAQTTYSKNNTSNGNQDEATVDVDRSSGTASGAAIDLVVSSDIGQGNTFATQGLFIAINYEVNTLNDPILNISFGGCEALNGQASTLYESSIFQQAASQGITTFVSSGDSGAASCNGYYTTIPTTQQLSINDLCASPYVTCVGGTEFADTSNPSAYWSSTDNSTNNSSILGYIPEGAWNEVTAPSGTTTTYSYGSTGGGVSTYIAKPSWQVGSGVLAGSYREVPDVAFPAALHDGFVVCLAYLNATCYNGFYVFGGTSVAAPSMAGVQALVNQKLGGRQGNINPTIYSLAANTSNVFHDATVASSAVSGCALTTPSMCNNSTPSPTSLTGGLQGYALTTGWDAVTGWGSLDVNNYITAAAAITALAPTTTALAANPTTITTAQTAVFTATVTSTTAGTPSGTVQFTSNGVNLGAAVTLVNGSASTPSLPFTTAGTYTLSAAYSGDSTYASSSANLTFQVTTPVLPATTTTVAGTASSITTQQTVGYTATVAPPSGNATTPTGTVQFVRTSGTTSANLGAAVALSGGVAVLPPTTLPAGTYTIKGVYSGDTNFSGSTSASVPLTVTAVATTTSISPTAQTTTTVLPLTFTATIAPTTSNAVVPTGTVQFFVDGVYPNGTPITIVGTTATSAPIYFSAGSHSVTAAYSGDTTFAVSSTLQPASVTVTLQPTSIAFTSAPSTLVQYASATLTATVSGLVSARSTAASVTFKDTTTGATLANPTITYSGSTATATVTTTFSTTGPHTLSATFAGDTNYATSTISTSINVTAAPTFALAPTSPSLSLASASSQSGTDVITAVTSSGFTGTISFTCGVALTSGAAAAVLPTCAASPASISFPGTTTTTVTLGTIAPHAIVAGPSARLDSLLKGSLVAFAGLLLFGLPLTRRSRNWRALAAILLLSGSLFGLSGCGSGSSSTPTPTGGTTTGAYTVTITGTANTGIPATSTTVALTVN